MSKFDDFSALEVSLDDIVDLPEYGAFAPGVHKCDLSFEIKEVKNERRIIVQLKHKETIELNNPEDTPPKPGDIASLMIDPTHEVAQGVFKKFMGPVAEVSGKGTMRELMEYADGMEVFAVTGVRKKDDATYLTLHSVTPV